MSRKTQHTRFEDRILRKLANEDKPQIVPPWEEEEFTCSLSLSLLPPAKRSVDGEEEEDFYAEDEEHSHKCPAFVPCSRAECKLRVKRKKEKEALKCRRCDSKLYCTYSTCCAEENQLCEDCCCPDP